VHGYLRSHPLPAEDVRSQVAYLDTQFRSGDAVIVDSSATYAFAYYTHGAKVGFRHTNLAAVGFQPTFPQEPWVITMPDRQPADVAAALATATDMVRPGARIWIVRSHLGSQEAAAWDEALANRRVTTVPVGTEPLLFVGS
jgi:hypothetical protein